MFRTSISQIRAHRVLNMDSAKLPAPARNKPVYFLPVPVLFVARRTSETCLRDMSDRRSAITLLKPGRSTKWAWIRTRRGEIDYGEHDRHGFVKSMFWINDFLESTITLIKTYEWTKWALIQTQRGEIDYGEHDRHGFVKSMFWMMTSDTNPP